MSGIQQLLLGGSPAGYQIERSLRFNSADSAYLNRTPASAGNRTTWTWSAWFKRGALSDANLTWLFGAGSTDETNIYLRDTDVFELRQVTSSVEAWKLTSTQVFRDPSAFYHLIVACDTTQATASNRLKVYVNGVQITSFSTASYPAQNNNTHINNNVAHYIGKRASASVYCNGLFAEINFIDGQALTQSSFGQNNASTGVWEPIRYTGTYGTNGFYLNFSDNSNTTAATLGKDSSGNGNNWTPNNFSVTAGAGNDSLVDTPTSYGTDTGAGGEVRGNYCTWNGVSIGTDATLANGNLDISYGSGITRNGTMGTFGMSSGKWYWEVTVTASSASPTNAGIGISNNPSSSSVANYPGFTSTSWGYVGDGNKYNNSSPSAYGATYTTNDVISFAFDVDAGSITAYKNGVSQGVMFSGLAANTYYPAIGDGGGASTFTAAANFGQRPFAYTAPSGFKALCTQNLPTPTIGATSTTQAGKYFDVSLWTGTSASQTITNSGFQPDLIWTKNRNGTNPNLLNDSVRGITAYLQSNATSAEATDSTSFTSFNSNGFTLGANTGGGWNTSGNTYVGWQWNAGGSNATNTSGTITSTVRANTTAGFSIVTYTGTGSAATVGHGLGVAPSMVIIRNRAGASWPVYHASIGNTAAVFLNLTLASTTSITYFNNTSPTTSVFSVESATSTNGSTNSMVAYCFAAVAGYSAFGSYTGNGSTDGTFVYLGFRPRFVMVKASSTAGYNWTILDSARDTYNPETSLLYPSLSNAENTGTARQDFLSNGFKLRDSSNDNVSGVTYIYAAFAESPFKYSLAR